MPRDFWSHFYYYYYYFLWLHLQHMKVPGLRVESRPQLRPIPQLGQCQVLQPTEPGQRSNLYLYSNPSHCITYSNSSLRFPKSESFMTKIKWSNNLRKIRNYVWPSIPINVNVERIFSIFLIFQVIVSRSVSTVPDSIFAKMSYAPNVPW